MTTSNKTAGLQTFNTAYPFDFKIQNEYQGEELPVIYIVDSNSSKELQKVTFAISTPNDQEVKLNGYDIGYPTKPKQLKTLPCLSPANTIFTPSESSFNIALLFKNGVIRDELLPNLSNLIQSALINAIPSNPSVVYGPVVRKSDYANIWYCAFEKDLDITNGFSFTINGISAEPSVGSRSSQVELHIGNTVINENSTALTFSKSAHIDIINHQGHSFAPLVFEVQGDSRLLNNANNPNLNIFFESIGQIPIEFGPKTKFSFIFSYANADSPLMHLDTSSNVKSIYLKTDKLTKKAQESVVPFNGTNTINPDGTNSANPNFTNLYSATANKVDDSVNSNVIYDISFQGEIITNPYLSDIKQTIQSFGSLKTNSKNACIATLEKNFNTLIGKSTPQNVDGNEIIGNDFFPILNTISSYYVENLNNLNTVKGWRLTYTDEDNRVWTQGTFELQNFSKSSWDTAINDLLGCINQIATRAAQDVMQPWITKPSLYFQDYFNDESTFKQSESSSWSDAFSAFLIQNFSLIINNISAIPKNNFWPTNHPNRILPTPELLKYLQDVFTAFQNYLQYKQFSLFSGTAITKENWITSYNNAVNLLGDNNSIDSSTFITEQVPFNPDNFYLNPNVLDKANKIVPTLVNSGENILFKDPNVSTPIYYLLPSINLFEFFKASYEFDYYTSKEKIQYYINPTSCLFKFNNVLLSGQDGTILLHIKVEGLPGYWDTDFTIPITKSDFAFFEDNLTVNGRIKDQTGYVMPPGCIVAFWGHDIPDGWLPCDGTTDCSKYPDLVKVLGNDKTPRVPPLAPGVQHIIKC